MNLDLIFRIILIPVGVLIVLAIAFGGIRRTPKKGTCWQCGYDVRATPRRCPECGTVQERT
jgi:hypothetical protein